MKRHLASLFTTFLLIAVVGCTTTSEVYPLSSAYVLDNNTKEGIAFSMPKTVFELKVTYSYYKTFTWPSGEDGKAKKFEKGKAVKPKEAKVVVIEKPITLNPVTIPDHTANFIFDPNSLDGFTKDTDITLNFVNGMVKSTNIIVDDKSPEIAANVTSTIVSAALSAAVAGTEVVERELIKEIDIIKQIDPETLTYTQKKEGGMYVGKYEELEKISGLFGDGILNFPKVTVHFVSPDELSKRESINVSKLQAKGASPLNGIPYRLGETVEAKVFLRGYEISNGFYTMKQRGGLALMSLNAKSFSKVTQGVTFGDDGSGITKYTSKGTSSGEALTLAASESSASIKQGIIDREQAKLDMLKKQQEIQTVEAGLESSESLESIEAELALINKKVELAEAKAKLAVAEKKLEEESTE